MSSSPEPVEERIKIRVSNQKGYLWDLNDIQKLRVQHHICGSLQGTLPQVTQQNVFLGLPLVLLPEEVVLLVKNQIAVLIDEPSAHLVPTLSQSSSYSKSRQSAIESQQLMTHTYESEKAIEMKAVHADKIEKKRRLKLEKLGKQKQDGFEVFVPDILEGKENTGPPVSGKEEEGSRREPTKEELDKIPYTILIDPTSSPYPWYDPTSPQVICETLEQAREKKVWNYPGEGNRLQESKCRVFEDLWSKGFYMGGGLRFGGDFLVYPGDPLRYHSHFTLTILSTPTTSIMPLDLVAYGRLATAVKKSHLLASWNEEKGEADYLSLEWAAFG